MNVSQKCQYALRAIFELAKRKGHGPITAAEIANSQAIPRGFLEVILVELKKAGFINSRRGMRGGYQLAVLPGALTVGAIISSVDGPVAPIKCVADTNATDCPLYGTCAFLPLWERVKGAVTEIYDSTTFQDLLDHETTGRGRHIGLNI